MSNVRISNGSPTLERVDSRSTDHTKAPVCRNLFGPVDHDEFNKDCKKKMQEMTRASTEKWNFDFAQNAPLSDGKFEWREVDGRAVPEFYTRPPRIRADSPNGVDLNGNHDLNTMYAAPPCASGGGRSADTDAGRSQQDISELCNPSRKRHASQESPRLSKRPNTSSGEVCRSRDTTLLEQTPSKSGPGHNHKR